MIMDIRENDHRMLEPVLVKGLTWDQCDRAPEPVQLPAVVEPAVPDDQHASLMKVIADHRRAA